MRARLPLSRGVLPCALLALGCSPSDAGTTAEGTPLGTSGATTTGTSANTGAAAAGAAPGAGGVSTATGASTSGTGTTGGATNAGTSGGGSTATGAVGGATSGGNAAVAGSGSGGATGRAGATGVGGAGSGGTSGGAGAGGESPGRGGSGGAPPGGVFEVPFVLGADISSVQEGNDTFVDTDGQTKSIFELLQNHGFNYIRIKAFVDPNAPYGYASTSNGCTGFPEPFGDKAHVVEFGKQIKAAGMGFLLDFHYSDVWADPGNQIIPEPWRGASDIDELAAFVRDYTMDVVSTAIAENARPDMVQIGNEITPGMLMHVPGSNTDCWGNNPSGAPVSGSTSNWNNLGTLLRAGAGAVREVDPNILIMLHIENTDDLDGARWWVDNAVDQGVDFDVMGLSCYTAFQGQPSVWENTLGTLAADHPSLKFVIAEYNPARTEANRVVRDMPNGQGLGTFFWEPTRSGEWGDSMFTWQNGSQRANADDFAEYDAMLPMLGLQ